MKISLRSPLALALAALVCGAAGRTLGDGGGRPSASSRPASSVEEPQQRRRWFRRPPAAFQYSEPKFELTPQEYGSEKPYLLQFKGKGDDYCAQMEPLKEQLKEELGVNIRCFEVEPHAHGELCNATLFPTTL